MMRWRGDAQKTEAPRHNQPPCAAELVAAPVEFPACQEAGEMGQPASVQDPELGLRCLFGTAKNLLAERRTNPEPGLALETV